MDTKAKPPEVDPPEPHEDEDDLDEAMPRVQVTRRSLILGVFFVVSAVAFLYFVLPQLADLKEQGEQVGEGNRLWLGVAFVFTLASFGGYVMMFQGVFVRAGSTRGRGSTGARATRSRWPAWRPRGCSRPAARAGSR